MGCSASKQTHAINNESGDMSATKTFQLKRKAGTGLGIKLSGGAGQTPAPNQHNKRTYANDVKK